MEICDKEDDKNPKIITLENCVKITQEPAPANQINIFTKTGTLTLNALNELELKHWVQALQSVAFKDKSYTLPRNSVIEEDNDLYCSSYNEGIFTVKILASDIAELKCGLEAKTYLLHLTATEIQLKDFEDHSILVVKWPYRYIRKYGYRDGKFTFEAGRKCDTGEGSFSFVHSNPQEVFRCMANKMKSMKKLINGESIASLDCGEHQLNAALSMEAGSRSPLPPSPNHQSHSENDISQSGHLIRGFLSSNDSLNNVSTSSSVSSVIKHIPNKPPRKSLTSIENNDKGRDLPVKPQKFTKYQDYEPVSLAQTGPPDSAKSTTVVLKPAPPIPTSSSTNSSKSLVSIISDSGSNHPIQDAPPQLPLRNESMTLDDRNYERIENISNAWKTLGVNDVKHTEHHTNSEDGLVEFVWQRSQSQKDLGGDARRNKKPLPTISAYCDADELPLAKKNIEDNYDKLEFFATKTNNTSNDYRTIVTINTPAYKKQTSQPVTSNDYEIIGECGSTMPVPDHKTYRLADDSHMGYGVLRKPGSLNTSGTQYQAKSNLPSPISGFTDTDEFLHHRKFNGLEYAMVSKPKQV